MRAQERKKQKWPGGGAPGDFLCVRASPRHSRSQRPWHHSSPEFSLTTCAWPLLRLLIQLDPSSAPLVTFNTHSTEALLVLAASTSQLMQVRTTSTTSAACSHFGSLHRRCASDTAFQWLSTLSSRSQAHMLHVFVRRWFKRSSPADSESLFDATCF